MGIAPLGMFALFTMVNRRALDSEATWAKEHSKLVVERNIECENKKISKYIQGCDALVQAIGPEAPKCLSEYCASMHAGIDAINDLKFTVPRINGPYMVPWTARGIVIDLLVASDVSDLIVDKDITLSRFISANPDQKSQLQQFRSALANVGKAPKHVKEFLGAIAGKHIRPELLSMHACFAVDDGVQDTDLDNMDYNTWDKCATALEREWGVAPHLAMVAQAARCTE